MRLAFRCYVTAMARNQEPGSERQKRGQEMTFYKIARTVMLNRLGPVKTPQFSCNYSSLIKKLIQPFTYLVPYTLWQPHFLSSCPLRHKARHECATRIYTAKTSAAVSCSPVSYTCSYPTPTRSPTHAPPKHRPKHGPACLSPNSNFNPTQHMRKRTT